MTLLKTLGTIAVCSIIASCTPAPEKTYVPVNKPPLNLEVTPQSKTNAPYFHVVTDRNYSEKFLQIKKTNNLPVLVCITSKDYEDFSKTVLDNELYIRELQRIIQSYKNYYEESAPKKE